LQIFEESHTIRFWIVTLSKNFEGILKLNGVLIQDQILYPPLPFWLVIGVLVLSKTKRKKKLEWNGATCIRKRSKQFRKHGIVLSLIKNKDKFMKCLRNYF